jgi:hypothetical protein
MYFSRHIDLEYCDRAIAEDRKLEHKDDTTSSGMKFIPTLLKNGKLLLLMMMSESKSVNEHSVGV